MLQPSSPRCSAPGLAVFLALTVPLGMELGKLHAEGPLSENKPELTPGVAQAQLGPPLRNDLTQVPEVSFQAPVARGTSAEANRRQLAQQFARIRERNASKTDGFMEALLARRSDLAGLPFVLGEACRTNPDRDHVFASESFMLRLDAEGGEGVKLVGDPDAYWEQVRARHKKAAEEAAKDASYPPRAARSWQENVSPARVAALMQVLAPEDRATHLEMVRELASIAHADATRALVKLALFSNEDQVRRAAVKALVVRRERDYTEMLLQGLRYPWPTVARRASEALVRLGRTDLVPKLVEVLEQPDRRLPVVQEVEGKPVPVVRELVRINHHRNCLLCHAPVNDPNLPGSGPMPPVTATVPIPGLPLPKGQEYYQGSEPALLVRVDVTYLRQDFSLVQPVANADPWPEMQRFDFLVRTRTLSEEEAQAYRDQLRPREPGVLSPYHRAALAALRELAGKDAGPTAQAWRKLLGQVAARRTSETP